MRKWRGWDVLEEGSKKIGDLLLNVDYVPSGNVDMSWRESCDTVPLEGSNEKMERLGCT